MFSILTSLLRHNYDIYLFDVVTFFDNFKIALDFVTFEVSMEKKFCFCSSLWRIFITSQLRYLFVQYCYLFWLTLELRYISVLLSYVRK